MTYKTSLTWSGLDAQVSADGRLLVELYATASGTGVVTPLLCDANGILLVSGLN